MIRNNDSIIKFIRRREILVLTVILLFGFIIRAGLIFSVEEPINKDAKQYYEIAQNILSGNGFSIDGHNPTARRSAGYPIILAIFIAIFGKEPGMLYLIQAIFNIFSVFLIWASLKNFNVKLLIRIGVTIIYTFSTSFVYVNVLYPTVFSIFFTSLLVYILSANLNEKIRIISTGIVIGILIHIRPPFLYFPFFLLLLAPLILFAKHKALFKNTIIISLIAIISVLPWTLRNKMAFNKFIPLVSAGGIELWLSNVEIQLQTVWYSVTDIQKYEDQRTQSFALQNQLKSKYRRENNFQSEGELNQFLFDEGKRIIKQRPFRFLILCLNRLLIFWFSPPIGASTMKSISPILFWIILFIKYFLTILAITGLCQLSKHHFEQFCLIILLVVYLTFLHSAVHSIQRYFLPLIPICYFSLGYYLNNSIIKSEE